jgi:hypothetical protein
LFKALALKEEVKKSNVRVEKMVLTPGFPHLADSFSTKCVEIRNWDTSELEIICVNPSN